MKHRYQFVVALLIVTLMVGSFFAGRQFQNVAAAAPSSHKGLARMVSTMLTSGEGYSGGVQDVNSSPLETFQEVLTHIRRDYVSNVNDERKLTYAAINGMLGTLHAAPYSDRYTRFMEPQDYRAFMDENEGHFGGIGAEIGVREVKNPGDEAQAPEPERAADLDKPRPT